MKIKLVFHGEIMRYLLVGGVSVGLDAIVYAALVATETFDPTLAKRLSFISGDFGHLLPISFL
jgi:putative flippase GtrA